MSNSGTTTQKSIEDKYEEDFNLLVELFYNDAIEFDFTEDEYREIAEEVIRQIKENRS